MKKYYAESCPLEAVDMLVQLFNLNLVDALEGVLLDTMLFKNDNYTVLAIDTYVNANQSAYIIYVSEDSDDEYALQYWFDHDLRYSKEYQASV